MTMPIAFDKLVQAAESVHESVSDNILIEGIEIIGANSLMVMYDGDLDDGALEEIRKQSVVYFGVDLSFIKQNSGGEDGTRQE